MLVAVLAFVATGAVAGLLAGLLGVGGGAIIVPALIYLLPLVGVPTAALTQVAVGTSLACISLISVNSTIAHHRRGGVVWPVFARLTPGLVLGAIAGAALAHGLTSLTLRRIIGVAALLMALKMAAGLRGQADNRLPGAPGLAAVGGVIGMLSALVGIGGGSLTVPFLAWCRMAMSRAVATSAACGMPIAWAGTLGFVVIGWGNSPDAAASLGYIYLPAAAGVIAGSLAMTPVGAMLAHRLPATALRRVFAVVLAVVGCDMLFA
ncbi:MAG: sulfite exporter TauE/SafE family protein [Salinisphaera sp.]|nr:sulfite exporter TauE/SafE family protein [Salinisphaera sp.]MDN5937339.1 sulfite exporter TauE/SafE family protein [Salinisphaera sp.]